MAVAIKVENLSKAYQLGEIGTGTMSQDFQRWLAKKKGKEDPFMVIGQENDRTAKGTSDVVWSLKDINFEINQGDAVGIIGKNGAGKSTLLKLLSRVTAPTTGFIKARGRIASLLEVGTGFHPELTGRENIYLNGAILGMRKREITRKFDEIVAFSGVERYIDTPVKRYSSGMYVRLAFAVAAHLESETLIVDEVLAVGDAEFQKKCLGKMGEVSKGEGRTVLFVSHNLTSIKQLCQTSILLSNGRLIKKDSTASIISKYLQLGASKNSQYLGASQSEQKLWIKKIYVADFSGKEKEDFLHSEKISLNFEIGYNIKIEKNEYKLFVMILDEYKTRVFSTESEVLRSEKFKVVIDQNFLVRGSYSIHTFIHKPGIEQIDVVEDVCNFTIIDTDSPFTIHGDYDYGKVFPRTTWHYQP